MIMNFKTGAFAHNTTIARVLFATGMVLGSTGAALAADMTTNDVRCVVVEATKMGGSRDPATRASAGSEMLYFVGKLDGRAEKMNLAAEMDKQAEKMDSPTLIAEDGRCQREMQAMSARIGQTLVDANNAWIKTHPQPAPQEQQGPEKPNTPAAPNAAPAPEAKPKTP
jgi:hypothetical protein